MHLYIFLFSSLIFCHAQLSVVTIKLPSELEETSGLEFKGNHLLTHNDSGDKARLYEFNTEGKLIKSTLFYDLKNKDWEDLAADDHHYYIADTGNNFATRENLRIYILNKELIPEGTIQIRYEAQKSFSKASINEYDA